MNTNDAITGRLDGMIIDIASANFSADRLMQTAGYTKLANKAKDLRGKWFKSVVEHVTA